MEHGKFRLFRRQHRGGLTQTVRVDEDLLPGNGLKPRQPRLLRHGRSGRDFPGLLFAAARPLPCGGGAGLNGGNGFAAQKAFHAFGGLVQLVVLQKRDAFVHFLPRAVGKVRLNGRVTADGAQVAAQKSRFPARSQLFAQLALDLVRMGQYLVQTAVLGDQF